MDTLNLIGNKFTRPNKYLRRIQFVKVKIARNQIQDLTNEDFQKTHTTENIDLQENQIRRIDTDTFKTLRKKLNKLDLSSNLIFSLNGSVRYLSQLRMLNLTNNMIEVIIFSCYAVLYFGVYIFRMPEYVACR